jgi:hypothetical protein
MKPLASSDLGVGGADCTTLDQARYVDMASADPQNRVSNSIQGYLSPPSRDTQHLNAEGAAVSCGGVPVGLAASPVVSTPR